MIPPAMIGPRRFTGSGGTGCEGGGRKPFSAFFRIGAAFLSPTEPSILAIKDLAMWNLLPIVYLPQASPFSVLTDIGSMPHNGHGRDRMATSKSTVFFEPADASR
jgi:hypothetical protein